jgi:AcrR family transcriptional regulator
MTTRRDSTSQTGENHLDQATTLFSERGYSATSIRDIIQAAGVTQPTLYYHFADKRSLFEELIKRHYEDSQQQLENIIETEVGCEARLRLFVQRSFEFCNADHRVPRLMSQTYHGPRVAEIDGILDKLTDRRFWLIKKTTQDGIIEGRLRSSDPEFLALGFCCLMDQPLNLFSRRSEPNRYLTDDLATARQSSSFMKSSIASSYCLASSLSLANCNNWSALFRRR